MIASGDVERLSTMRFMTRTMGAPSSWVIDAVIDAAHDLGLDTTALDRHTGEVRLRRDLGKLGRTRRLWVTITDNGRGGSTLHTAWEDGWRDRVSARRDAVRLFDEARRRLA